MKTSTDTKSIYKRQEIKSATPAELVGHLYDFGIEACHAKNGKKLKDVISQLIRSLNFDLEMSEDFYRLYDFCRQKANEGQFEDVLLILEDMRDGWKPVIESHRASGNKSAFSINV
jgi:flagellin-specific chaperone FliS